MPRMVNAGSTGPFAGQTGMGRSVGMIAVVWSWGKLCDHDHFLIISLAFT